MNQILGRKLAANEISEEDIVAVMKRCPTLGAYGFGRFAQYHLDLASDNYEEFERNRSELGIE
jgi:hypothetical protein